MVDGERKAVCWDLISVGPASRCEYEAWLLPLLESFLPALVLSLFLSRVFVSDGKELLVATLKTGVCAVLLIAPSWVQTFHFTLYTHAGKTISFPENILLCFPSC